MLTDKQDDSQADFTNSPELGALIEESEKRLEKLMMVAGGWLFGGVLIGAMCAPGYGWSGFGFGILLSAIGIAMNVVQRFSGKAANRVFRVHEHGLYLLSLIHI